MKKIFLAISILWTIVWWYISWSGIPFLSPYAFFPLWLGYIFVINALTEMFYGDSLLKKMRFDFVWLFIISIPMWWGFEYINSFVKNWNYIFPTPISSLNYTIQSSIYFSTVVPAVLSTLYLLRKIIKNNTNSPPASFSKTTRRNLFLVGIITLLLIPVFPRQLFLFVWVSPFLIIDTFNYSRNIPSVIGYIKKHGYHIMHLSMLSGLVCGVFWEMWNYYSTPKWEYSVPYVGFWKIFEMPLLGYLGYLPFGLLVLSYTLFMWSWLQDCGWAKKISFVE